MAYRRKGRKEAEVVPMTAEEIGIIEEHVDELVRSQLPIGRVKKIVRLDPDVEMVNSEAVTLMTKAAEMFIVELGKAANTNAAIEKRKNVQLKDIEKCIKQNWTFAFLEDAVDGWPKMETRKRKVNNEGENTTLVEESAEPAEGEDGEENDENDPSETNDLDDTVVNNENEETEESAENSQEEFVDKFAEQF